MDTRIELEEKNRREQLMKFQLFMIIALIIIGLSGVCVYCGYALRVNQEDQIRDTAIQELQGDTILINGKAYILNLKEIR